MPRAVECPNQLFLSFLEEVRDAARDKGSKIADTYGKACKSIKTCPVKYDRPSDLIALMGVGPKIIQIIDKKWRKHCEENDVDIPPTPEKTAPTRKGKGKAKAPPSDLHRNERAGGLNSDDDDDEPQPAKRARVTNAKAYIPAVGTGGYGILLALVLALDRPQITTQVFMTKSEIIRTAQPFSTTSYETKEKGSYFNAWNNMKTLVNKAYVYATGNPLNYCLTEEGYDVAVTIRNLLPEYAHMPRYPFIGTPNAGLPARPLASTSRPNQGISRHGFLDDSPPPRDRSSPLLQAAKSKAPRPQSAAPRPSSSTEINRHPSHPVASGSGSVAVSRPSAPAPNGKFQFWYIDSAGARTSLMKDAMVRLDPEDFVNIRRLEFRASQKTHAIVSQLKLVDATPKIRDSSSLPTYIGFILEEGAPPACSKFEEHIRSALPPGIAPVPVRKPSENLAALLAAERPRVVTDPTRNSNARIGHVATHKRPAVSDYRTAKSPTPYMSEDDGHDLLSSPTVVPIRMMPKSAIARTTSVPVPQMPTTSGAEVAARRIQQSSGPTRTHSATADFSAPANIPARPRLSSHMAAPALLLDTDMNPEADVPIPNFRPVDSIIFPAGSYEIVLVLDNREVETKKNRDGIREALIAKGVTVDTRALRLGDMCWIARRRDGYGDEDDECVLNYVVERKRLDDLVSSIKDGRYNDQCVAEKMLTDGLAINTAKSQLQVANRFFLKETKKLSETIDFLHTMTEVIKARHQSDLHMIPTRYISRPSYCALQKHLTKEYPATQYLTSFAAYQDLNDKSKSKTLKECFAKMLCRVKGMSAERVSAVLDVWETPADLWEDLKVRAAQREPLDLAEGGKKSKHRGPEMFFADRIQGEGRRKIGDALSRDLYNAFMG